MNGTLFLLRPRFTTTAGICETFGPILKFADRSEEQTKVSCRTLTRAYPKDLTAGFEEGVLHLKKIHQATFPQDLSPLQLLNAIYNLQLQSIFGEICIEDFLHPTRKCCWRRTGFQQNEASQKLPEVHHVPGQTEQSCSSLD